MSNQNQDLYRDDDAVQIYVGMSLVGRPEARALADLEPTVREGRVLDIGIGVGRTVPVLSEPAASYVGIDYSERMVEVARSQYPGADLSWGDARDLSRFADDSFDLVVFSFNGIDSVPPDDRLLVLAEVRRVLDPGGVFLFSSHNREYERFNLLPWQRTRRFGRRTLVASAHALRHLPRHLRLRRGEVHTEEYAIINDEAHDFALMHYYISPERQRAQLGAAGFGTARLYDAFGEEVLSGSAPTSNWIYYAARA
ncbi:class I SAM-dependent methyltransferase [Nocardioides mangrovicus]|uniref:Class I SAM-dependent methyltransferase n=1 Tax=Nocardioides mangrovicus TaxID=2478913 RepID=A0A3L8NWU8_9ACTN|nr:class I SAM-dependent methyltransferase [Nocardioides mangrovicus]RLV47635.1 class I SAM-dependent methyltransferase [Nocardioides mangrovicus]